MKDDIIRLADSLTNGMFADRDSLQEAFDYAFSVANASGSPPHVVTAIMVVNTIAKTMREIANDSH